MGEIKEKYINLFTDYGFKRVFGTDINKELLIDFLNELLENEEGKIKNITFLSSEHVGYTETDRKAIFDLYCENERGEKFIVELQKARQNYFKDRSVFYSTFPIQSQAQKGDWNYNLKAVYAIGILDFLFDKEKLQPGKKNKIVSTVKLSDIDTKEVFYDKLTFVYIEVPKFNTKLEDLKTHFEKWLYVFKYLHRLQDRPIELQETIFNKLFETAEISKFTETEYIEYESSLKYYRDFMNSLVTAKEEGKIEGKIEGEKIGVEKGIIEGKIETAKKMHADGLSLAIIAKYVDLEVEELIVLLKK